MWREGRGGCFLGLYYKTITLISSWFLQRFMVPCRRIWSIQTAAFNESKAVNVFRCCNVWFECRTKYVHNVSEPHARLPLSPACCFNLDCVKAHLHWIPVTLLLSLTLLSPAASLKTTNQKLMYVDIRSDSAGITTVMNCTGWAWFYNALRGRSLLRFIFSFSF